MRLFYSSASPFASKVRMAAHHCDLALDCVSTDTSAEPDDLLSANPLGKIPALVLDDGGVLYDSAVICDYFDKMTGGQLVPQGIDDWRAVKLVEATADGVGDALILTVYEERYRPEDKRHQPWVEKQTRKADRGLEVLETMVANLPDRLTTAHFALASLFGWMDIRFAGKLAAERPALAEWYAGFPNAFPAFENLRPKAA